MEKTLAKRLAAKAMAVILACTILVSGLFSAGQFVYTEAATFEDINRSEVFLKQPGGSNICTLVSATMMVRRAAMLNNNADWAAISIDMMTSAAWVTGQGLKWEFSCGGVSVKHDNFSGSTTDLAAKLALHPEGIVLYKQKNDQNHAVLVTDYTGGVFYCADPSPAAPEGRIPMEQATIQIADANYIWYVSSPDLYLTDANGNVISREDIGDGSVPKATVKPTATPKVTATPKPTSKPNTTATPKPKTTEKPKAVEAPKKVSSLIVKNNKKKTLTTSWKGVSGAEGYQILYGTEKTFAGCASISQSKKKCRLTKLTRGKVYYVKVRAYNMNGSSRIYGQCSTVKKVKVKK